MCVYPLFSYSLYTHSYPYNNIYRNVVRLLLVDFRVQLIPNRRVKMQPTLLKCDSTKRDYFASGWHVYSQTLKWLKYVYRYPVKKGLDHSHTITFTVYISAWLLIHVTGFLRYFLRENNYIPTNALMSSYRHLIRW